MLFASQGLILCVLFNLAVPFLLVYLQASQFNQLGYFANAMCFTFLQLRPVVGWQGLAIQMGALAYGLLVLTAALLLCFPGNKRGILLTLRKRADSFGKSGTKKDRFRAGRDRQ